MSKKNKRDPQIPQSDDEFHNIETHFQFDMSKNSKNNDKIKKNKCKYGSIVRNAAIQIYHLINSSIR